MLIFRHLTLATLSLLSGLATAADSSAGTVVTTVATTEAVWSHHIAAWDARDLESIASDYGDDSILVLNGQMFRGRLAIKSVFGQLFQIFDRGQNRIDSPLLDGRVVYITWHFTPANQAAFYGTDTFLIEGGIIMVQTIASPLYDEFRIERPTD